MISLTASSGGQGMGSPAKQLFRNKHMGVNVAPSDHFIKDDHDYHDMKRYEMMPKAIKSTQVFLAKNRQDPLAKIIPGSHAKIPDFQLWDPMPQGFSG